MGRSNTTAACLFILLLGMPRMGAGDMDENLVYMSLEIFPKMVAVDLDLDRKLTPEGKIRLLVYYHKKGEWAKEVVRILSEKIETVSSKSIEAVSSDTLNSVVPTAILIVERLDKEHLKRVTDFSISRHILVFSPYEQDVKRGIIAGMSLQIRINITLLNTSDLG